MPCNKLKKAKIPFSTFVLFKAMLKRSLQLVELQASLELKMALKPTFGFLATPLSLQNAYGLNAA